MNVWEQNACHVRDIYGVYVNWDERFYLCPECGEPIYESDWNFTEEDELCPVCGFIGEEE